MFSRAFKSLVSNPAVTNQLLKATLSHLVIPAQAALVSGRFLKKPPSMTPKPIFFPPQVKTSLNQPVARFGFCSNFKPDHQDTEQSEQEKKTKEDQSKLLMKFEDMKALVPTLQERAGFNSYMAKVSLTTGLAMAGTLGIAYAMTPLATSIGGHVLGFSAFLWTGLNSIFPYMYNKITTINEISPDGKIVQTSKSHFIRRSAIASSAIFFGYLFLKYINPAILPVAAVTSLLTMGGSSLYALYRSPDKFKIWESVLFGSLTGLIGVNLLALMAGPGAFLAACFSPGFYAGMGLLAAFQAYNTKRAFKAFEAGNDDPNAYVVDLYKAIVRAYKNKMEEYYECDKYFVLFSLFL